MDNVNNDFECKQCGNCCSCILPLSNKEIERIKNYIHKNKINPNTANNILQKEFVDKCPFLNEQNKCSIYEVRPEICRWFRCDLYSNNKAPFNHSNKKMHNMLTTFYPKFLSPRTDLLKEASKEYYEYKKRVFRR